MVYTVRMNVDAFGTFLSIKRTLYTNMITLPCSDQIYNHAYPINAGIDFLIDGGSSQIITFGPLDLSKEVRVSILHDDIGEGDELIILGLHTDVENNVININSGQKTAFITIIEDDCRL